MATVPKRIAVRPGSELGQLLDEAAEGPVLLEKEGVTFRLTVEVTDRGAEYDPELALAAMRSAAGSWQDIDPEAFKAFLYRGCADTVCQVPTD